MHSVLLFAKIYPDITFSSAKRINLLSIVYFRGEGHLPMDQNSAEAGETGKRCGKLYVKKAKRKGKRSLVNFDVIPTMVRLCFEIEKLP